MGESPPRTSPWPLFVALGLATAELGVLFGLPAVAVGGVLVFGTSAAAVASEAGLAATPWRALVAIGLLVGAAAAVVWLLRSPAVTPDAIGATAATDGVAARAAVVLGGGLILAVAGAAGGLLEATK